MAIYPSVLGLVLLGGVVFSDLAALVTGAVRPREDCR